MKAGRSGPGLITQEPGYCRWVRSAGKNWKPMTFSLTDLFLVGLGYDITGAILLARGLIASATGISLLVATYWGGFNNDDAVDRCKNRIDGESGLALLALGFLLQAVGYVLEVSGVHTASGGAGRAITAVVLAVVAVIPLLGLWWVLRPRRLKFLLIKVAKEAPGAGEDLSPEEQAELGTWSRARVLRLVELGIAADWEVLESDSDGVPPGWEEVVGSPEEEIGEVTWVNYIRRVFGPEIPPIPIEYGQH
jgi:hypothetical protein